MDLYAIQNKVHERQSKPEGNYQRFAVFAPLVHVKDELHLLFEVRSQNLKRQPGEICFPGGKMEALESPEECALRETSEELNLPLQKIKSFGPLDYIVTPFNLILYPFLGTLPNIDIQSMHFSRDEVEEIFTVPLEYFFNTPPMEYDILLKTEAHENFPYHLIQQGENYNWKMGKYPVLFYEYNGYIIWGMTARIVKNIVDILKKN